jgi:hypothetical protein
MRRGGSVDVVVIDRATGAPVAGADVELRSTLTWKAATGADGIAKLRGVGPTWATLAAQAKDYAPAAMLLTTSGDPATTERVSIALSRGAAIAGRVIDEAGKPVAAPAWS